MKIRHQLDQMDCGPTCIAMIAEYYGKFYSLDRLRTKCFVSKDGVSMLDISNAAESIGFRTVGGYISYEDLKNGIQLPCILHWDQDHFVVLYRIKKTSKGYMIYIADPDKGNVKYNENDFLSHWASTLHNNVDSGIVLLFEPTPLFYELDEDKKVLKKGKLTFLMQYFLKYKKYFLQIAVGLLMGSFILLIFPFLTQAIVDIGIGNKNLKFIWVILLAELMLLAGKTSIDFIRSKLLLQIGSRINISLVSDFFVKLMKMPMSFFDSKLMGDLIQRIEDHKRIEDFLTSQTLNLLFSLFSIIVLSAVLYIYDINIFIVFVLSSIVYILWIMFFLKKRRELDYRNFELESINRSKTYQLINGMQEIKLQGSEKRKRWEWEDTQADLYNNNLKVLSLRQNQEAGSICINELKNILITVLTATAVIKGELTLGMMLSVQYIIGQLNSPIEQIMNFIYQWQDVSISLDRMNDIHNSEDEISINRDIKSMKAANSKSINISKMTFQYEGPASKKVLDNVNITIPEGKITAIVGASGSGKTTLIKLILGYYTPTIGNIFINEQNILSFDLSWWRSICGVVLQDGYIFSESIARNIATSGDIDAERLQYAARIANIELFINQLPLKYNTIIGQEGQGLSQGQKQRILIARAVYKNPTFLFLDEATNALDANNEKEIVDNLNSFFKGKTVVIVAHRLSTVKNADQIIVLDQGKVAEIGNHENLTQKKGIYYQLVKNQLELGN